MKLTLAASFRAQPTAEDVERIRGMAPECKLIATIPSDAQPIDGIDDSIYHLNRYVLGVEKTLYYGNQILLPLVAKAIQEGGIMAILHADCTVRWKDAKRLITIIDRIPSIVFASAAPRTGLIPGTGPVILDYPDRFVVWRAETMAAYHAPFTMEEALTGFSTMQIIMERIKASGLDATSWLWDMNAPVDEPPIDPPKP
jgi:hypothetical protein